jgi:hypothetical protein
MKQHCVESELTGLLALTLLDFFDPLWAAPECWSCHDPTLAMAVMRESAISAFKPEPFYTVQIGLDGFTAASERFKTKEAAESVRQSCSVAIVQKAECKEKQKSRLRSMT